VVISKSNIDLIVVEISCEVCVLLRAANLEFFCCSSESDYYFLLGGKYSLLSVESTTPNVFLHKNAFDMNLI